MLPQQKLIKTHLDRRTKKSHIFTQFSSSFNLPRIRHVTFRYLRFIRSFCRSGFICSAQCQRGQITIFFLFIYFRRISYKHATLHFGTCASLGPTVDLASFVAHSVKGVKSHFFFHYFRRISYKQKHYVICQNIHVNKYRLH